MPRNKALSRIGTTGGAAELLDGIADGFVVRFEVSRQAGLVAVLDDDPIRSGFCDGADPARRSALLPQLDQRRSAHLESQARYHGNDR